MSGLEINLVILRGGVVAAGRFFSPPTTLCLFLDTHFIISLLVWSSYVTLHWLRGSVGIMTDNHLPSIITGQPLHFHIVKIAPFDSGH